jgi:hypothetical protein
LRIAPMRLRNQKAPSDIARMNAASMTSNEWVEAPSPSVSMRIQVIS